MPKTEDQDQLLAFALAPVALCVTRNRLITTCNTAFEELFGYSRAQLVQQSIAMLYPSANEFERIGQRGYPRMRLNGRYQDERLMRHQSGALIWCKTLGRAADRTQAVRAAVWSFEPTLAAPQVEWKLSPREREIIALLVRGLSSKQMALQLGLSPRTVDMHRARLLRKANVRSSAQLLSLWT